MRCVTQGEIEARGRRQARIARHHLVGHGARPDHRGAVRARPGALALGGVVADRYPKRRLLVSTQVGPALVSLTIGLLVVTGAVRLWQVAVLATSFGVLSAVDNPTRFAFVGEMVDRRRARRLQLAARRVLLGGIRRPPRAITRPTGPPPDGSYLRPASPQSP